VVLYLDTSFLVPLLITDLHTDRAMQALSTWTGPLAVSDLARAEFACVIGRRVRNRDLSHDDGTAALVTARLWASTHTQAVIEPGDLAEATAMLTDFALGLRMADAMHLACARRLDATIATFDVAMARCAQAFKVPIIGI
jgi:predicted nucleic acid-binding protein